VVLCLLLAACGVDAAAPASVARSTTSTSTTTSSSASTTTTAPATTTSVAPRAASVVPPTTAPGPAPAAATGGPCSGARAPEGITEVVWIVFENHQRGQVLGSPSAPYLSSLARTCASAADYHHVGRPSLPNYLGATSGATYGIDDDDSPAAHPIEADNLFRQVRAEGGRAVTYAESMPAACTLAGAGRYAVKHNPAAYYVGADDRAACERDDLPLGATTSGPFADDLRSGNLARFTLVIPDLCSDTHDCPVATGDAWLRRWGGAIFLSKAFRAGHVAVFVAWDEPTPMPFLAVLPGVTPGTVIRRTIDHYALLRTTEELLGLPLLAGAADAPSFRGDLRL
jgi:hypothetical protein